MSQVLLTIVAPLAPAHIPLAETAIDALEGGLRADPPALPLAALDDPGGEGTHFVSLHAIRSPSSERAYLLLELSADGTAERAVARAVAGLGDRLRAAFAWAEDWDDGGDLVTYLLAHQVAVGGGWLDHPGVGFVGGPGLTVGRIRSEAALAARAAELLEQTAADGGALDRLDRVRRALAAEAGAELLPAESARPWSRPSTATIGLDLVGSFLKTYLTPLIALILVAAVVAGGWAARNAPTVSAALDVAVRRGLKVGVGLALLSLLLVIAGLLGAYLKLLADEKTDAVDERAPDHRVNAAMFARENHARQNHMISITVRKPGWLRAFTSRLVFWFLGRAVGIAYPPGMLGTIGTIHFARWVTVPGTRDVVFLSNYDGSWESYLEDFITRAHKGLTAVWSNSVGFPRTRSLIRDGATDSERFKRYARRSMIPTRFWYTAYPGLTMAAIRVNADIRRGLSGAMSEDEAAAWLALFGSAPRPPAKLVSSGIQSILFGGMKFMPFGRCLVVGRLPDDATAARRWLDATRPHIAYNDGRRLRADAVVTLALGSGGLARLGLPPEAIESFAFAYVEGMTGAGRRAILGDDPATWRWGANGADAALLVYGRSAEAADALCNDIIAGLDEAGAGDLRVIPLQPIGDAKAEPFGFVDGISQPVIRGTYKGLRNADPIHLVEAGEFILGYPDDRGNTPPGPVLDALHDPDNSLPLVGAAHGFDRVQAANDRDLGFNGSYLVIRELEQDVDGLWAYCRQEAERLADDPRLPEPYVVTPDFVAAKLVGRWPDGSSLARFPYEPRTDERAHPTQRPTSLPAEDHAPIEKPPPGGDAPGDNDFLFGAEDPEALRCPFGAHIRRANPRDSLAPGAADEIGITNRHRTIRVGRPLAPVAGERPGILFMCLNGDIERQFEFIQQTWLRNPAFHGLTCEKDPLLGDGEAGNCSFTIPTRGGPVRLAPIDKPFVTTRGGGYFFLPGKRLVDFLSAPR